MKKNVYKLFISIFTVYIVFWREGASLFKVVCFIEVSSKVYLRKTNNFHVFALSCSSSLRSLMISQMHFFKVLTMIYVRVNFVRFKERTLKIRALRHLSAYCSVYT